MSAVNDDTDSQAPPFSLGHVMRDANLRILYLRRKLGVRARSKMDAKYATRQVPVAWVRSPAFGYVFRDLVVIGRRLQLGWRNSPGFWCLLASALDYSHVLTSYENAAITESGRDATAHVKVTRSEATEQLASLPRGCQTPQGTGGGIDDCFFVRYYVDDGILVELQWY